MRVWGLSMQISAVIERWPVAGSFNIARGAKTYVDVLLVAVRGDGVTGMGEGTAIYYKGESAESCLAQIEEIIPKIESVKPADVLDMIQSLLPVGAARNALDSALWDLKAKLCGKNISSLIGLTQPKALITAFTISLNPIEQMRKDAANAAANGYMLLKLKLTGEGDTQRVTAVREGAPHARLIVDANESWAKDGQLSLDIARQASELAALGVELIEQPVPHGQDHLLAGVKSPVPLCADESCHSADDLEMCARYYDAINIKLDKAGGLTAPAYLVAQDADWVDLDGPVLLEEDRDDGFLFKNGMIYSRL